MTDEQLMEMYQNGSEKAFSILYDRHSSKIFGFLKKRVQKEEKVTDIYQEVFVKIHKSKHLYNKSFPLLPWIFTITRTVMLDELKKDKNINLAIDIDLDSLPSSPTDFSLVNDNKTLGEAAASVQRLPEAQKLAIQMRYVDDKTFEEIALSLQTTPVNVRQLISRGVKRLKELLGERRSL